MINDLAKFHQILTRFDGIVIIRYSVRNPLPYFLLVTSLELNGELGILLWLKERKWQFFKSNFDKIKLN